MSKWNNSITGELNAGEPSSIQKYLQRNLGVTLKLRQDSNTMEAIKDPTKFLATRATAINDMFAEKGEIVIHFQQLMKKYSEAGLPDDICREMAMRSANRMYQEDLEYQDMLAPNSYQKAFGIAGLEHNTTIARDVITNDEAVSQYKARKAHKKAKKHAIRSQSTPTL